MAAGVYSSSSSSLILLRILGGISDSTAGSTGWLVLADSSLDWDDFISGALPSSLGVWWASLCPFLVMDAILPRTRCHVRKISRFASSSEISRLVFPSAFMRLISSSTSGAIGVPHRTYLFFSGSVGFLTDCFVDFKAYEKADSNRKNASFSWNFWTLFFIRSLAIKSEGILCRLGFYLGSPNPFAFRFPSTFSGDTAIFTWHEVSLMFCIKCCFLLGGALGRRPGLAVILSPKLGYLAPVEKVTFSNNPFFRYFRLLLYYPASFL